MYEMATGKKAFEGKSQASLIAKILEIDPPPISSLQPLSPPALDRVVKKCLAKEPEKRWQGASDLWDELRWIAEGGSQAALPVTAARGFGALGRRAVLLMLTGVLLGGIIASLAVWNLKSLAPPGGRPIARLAVVLSSGQQIAGLQFPAIALSPNGTQLAYVAAKGSTQKLYLRALDSLD